MSCNEGDPATDSADEVFEDAEDVPTKDVTLGEGANEKKSCDLSPLFKSSLSIVSSSSGIDSMPASPMASSSPGHKVCKATTGEETDSGSTKSGQSEPNLEESLHEVMELLHMALNNRFAEALEVSEKWAHVSLYHALGKATLGFLKGILTLEKCEIDNAMSSLKNLVEVCSQSRRSMSTLSRIVWRPNYNSYTDDEAHAELVYAEALLMISLMTFLGDQNLINLVKGAFRIRSCFQNYKECALILEERTTWSSDFSRIHFESGVKMGIGTFNLMISHMPSKILKILEVLGFSGNRATGFTQLEAACGMSSGLRSPLALLISMTYHCYVEHYFGTGDGDVDYVDNLLQGALKQYPKSAFFLLFAGRVAQLKGHLDEALEHFDSCIKVQSEWHQLHNVCHWESMWCRAIQCNWQSASEYADILREHCKWSPATYTYQYATFLYQIYEEESAKLEEEGEPLTTELVQLKNKIDQLINSVPSLRIRYAGKTVPCEKFAIVKSEKYYEEDSNGSLCMPALEFIYVWNMFTIMDRADHKYVNQILDKVEKNIAKYKPRKSASEAKEAKEALGSSSSSSSLDSGHSEENSDQVNGSIDRYCLCLMLKGVCLRTLGFPLQARENFLQILHLENRLVANTYLAPHSCMELGLTCAMDGDYQMAKQWLEKARKDYTGYLYETIVHFRVHCALRSVKGKEKQLQQQASNNQSQQKSNYEPLQAVSLKQVPEGKSKEALLAPATRASGQPSSSFTEMAKAMQANRSTTEDAMDRLLGL